METLFFLSLFSVKRNTPRKKLGLVLHQLNYSYERVMYVSSFFFFFFQCMNFLRASLQCVLSVGARVPRRLISISRKMAIFHDL